VTTHLDRDVREPEPDERTSSRSARRAYDRRRRREERIADPRLFRAGLPIRSALSKVPMVLASIAVLGGGIATVLTVNTLTDEIGLQINRTQNAIVDDRLRVQALEQEIADGNATPRIAEEAQRLGLAPAEDPAIIKLESGGGHQVIGSPHPQPPAAAPPTNPAAPVEPTGAHR
jgi:hypothetical protein